MLTAVVQMGSGADNITLPAENITLLTGNMKFPADDITLPAGNIEPVSTNIRLTAHIKAGRFSYNTALMPYSMALYPDTRVRTGNIVYV